MRASFHLVLIALLVAIPLGGDQSMAAEYPTPRRGEWIARDFKFETGEVLPEVRLAYQTVGDPKGEPVLILHGTTGSSSTLLTPQFAGELFGPGQPLDAARYYVVMPDALGAGKSSKPSDGLGARFPRFTYDDMVSGHHRLLTEGLGVRHVRLIIGNSMGGMHVWMWGVKHPGFADTLVPMAALPTEMSSRNWMLRRMMIEIIRNDPEYNGGNYTKQPQSTRLANAFFGLATNGGTPALQHQAPTREKADRIVDERLAAPFNTDANDFVYLYDASRTYNPAPHLERIEARVLAINSADDERNPAELGLMEREIKRIPEARYHLIPASTDTRGHGTTGAAKFWKEELRRLLDSAPRKAM